MSKRKSNTGAKPYGFKYQEAVAELANLAGVKAGPQSVLKSLLKHCNGETGQAYPSKETLAMDTGQGERTVQRHLRSLEELDLITPIAYAEGGRGRATCYKFALPQWSHPRATTKGAKMALIDEIKGANLSLKGAILSLKGANLAPQQREQRITRGRDAPERAASRGEGLNRLRGFTFGELVDREGYAEARRVWEGWEKEALRAAQNA